MIILAGILLNLQAEAQSDKSFRVNSVNRDSAALINSIYLYPQFTRGYILFRNQNLASAMLNYNRLSGQIVFINPKGDTLEPAYAQDIQFIAITSDTFQFHNKAYTQLITHYTGGVNLYKTEKIKYNGKEKKGAYGGYSATTAASSVDKVSNENDIKKIGVDENALYVLSRQYYLKDSSGKFFPASKKNFKKLFLLKEKEIDEYLQKIKINYVNEIDLLNFIAYLRN
jgi:hypothetical protein